jgi:hypothetical protein
MRVAALIACGLAGAAAADLRLQVSPVPVHGTLTSEHQGGGPEGEAIGRDDRGWRFGALLVHDLDDATGWGRPQLGLGAAYQAANVRTEVADHDGWALVGRCELGWALGLASWLDAEAAGLVGLGVAEGRRSDLTSRADKASNGQGTASEYGVRFGLTATVAGWQAAAGMRWVQERIEISGDARRSTATTPEDTWFKDRILRHGWTWCASLGWRL